MSNLEIKNNESFICEDKKYLKVSKKKERKHGKKTLAN